jgi:membrane-associated protease RseP (regulator of RpoE activity)
VENGGELESVLKATAVGPPPARFSWFGALCAVLFFIWVWAYPVHRDRLLAVYGSAAIVTIVHLSGFLIAGLAAGAAVEQVSLFCGGTLLRARIARRFWLTLSWIPMGGFVKFFGDDPEDRIAPRPGSFRGLPSAARILIPAAGSALCFVLALAVIGPSRSGGVITGFPHQLLDVCSSAGRRSLAARFIHATDRNTFRVLVGLLAVEMGLTNLLPFPLSNGGVILIEILETAVGAPLKSRVRTTLQLASLAVSLFFSIAMAYQLVVAWRSM